MKRLKLILVMLLAMVGILFFLPERSIADDLNIVDTRSEAVIESDSTYVESPDPGIPYGDLPFLNVGDIVEGGDGRCRGFLKFELPTLPANSTILGAQLCLYSLESEPAGRKRTIGVHRVDPLLVWDEAMARWNNPPGFGDAYEPAPTDSITSNFWPGWAYWDVTIDVSEVYGMPGHSTYSTAVIMEGEPDYTWNSFYTKEQPPEPNYAPRLVITYAPGEMFVPSGSDCYITESAEIRFGPLSGSPLPEIPAGFFGPGSDPFDGGVYLRSQPFDSNSGVDTKINRTKDVFLLESDPCLIPIELIELNLVSTTPITVTGNGIDFPAESFFDVYVQPLIVPAPGQMTVIKEHDTSGGTFQYDTISLSLVFDFVYAGPESEPPPGVFPTAQLEVYDLSIGATGLHGWRNLPDKHPPCGYDGFYPSGEGALDAELMYLAVPTGHLSWSPPKVVAPQFALITGEDWLQAVGEERVRPMSQEDGDDYIEQFNNNIGEGDEYPEDAEFLPSDLYVWEDPNGDNEPNDAGLMMTWGDPCATAGEPGHMEDGNDYASAWEYVYPGDPDLSNCIITVMIEPPCGIRVVSLGLKDINGNIRGWYWNVSPNAGPPPPGMIQCSPGPGQGGTKITIDLTQTGTTAATPGANSYSSNPNFDINKVAKISFDEDNVYVAATQAPVPGSGIKASWNYWYNLIVATKTPAVSVTSKYYVKWSQRPTVIDPNQPNLLLGWNEYSNY